MKNRRRNQNTRGGNLPPAVGQTFCVDEKTKEKLQTRHNIRNRVSSKAILTTQATFIDGRIGSSMASRTRKELR